MRIDLHTHTTASDGLLEPAALVRAVRAAQVEVFSLTDHDTVDAFAETQACARDARIELIPGIELSVYWKKIELHILGYFVDPTDPLFLRYLREMREARGTRLHTMLSRLFALGIAIPAEEVLALARDANVGRPHVARVLVQRGIVVTVDEAFDRYLGVDRVAYVPRPNLTIQGAIRAIRGAGGISSLAHPGLHDRDDAIPDLMAAGLDGIEVYHPKHSPGKTAHYRRLARRRGLLATGGSDFHGTGGSDHGSAPGSPCLPEPEFLRLRAAAEARRAAVGR